MKAVDKTNKRAKEERERSRRKKEGKEWFMADGNPIYLARILTKKQTSDKK